MIDDREMLERVVRVAQALSGVSEMDRLDVLGLVWLFTAANARNERIPFPDGFSQERDRQVDLLGKMRDLVETAEPDLEAERIELEHGPEAAFEYLAKRLRDADQQIGDDGGDKE